MDNQPLTKKDLREAIEELAAIVNGGFQEVHGKFQEVQDNIRSVDVRLDAKIEAVKRELLDSNEKIATEVHAMRQEQIAATGGRQRIGDTLLEHGDTLAEHGQRLVVLEGKFAH